MKTSENKTTAPEWSRVVHERPNGSVMTSSASFSTGARTASRLIRMNGIPEICIHRDWSRISTMRKHMAAFMILGIKISMI